MRYPRLVTTRTLSLPERFSDSGAQALFVAIAPAVLFGSLVMFLPSIIRDGDPYWHIAAGNWFIQHRMVPHTDPFSYTMAGAPWTAHEWLSEVLMAISYRAGFPGVYVLYGVAAAATVAILAITLLRFLPSIIALFILLFPILSLSQWYQARPQFLVLPIAMLWMRELLVARQEDRAPRWYLALLSTLWANLHGSFIIGFVLVIIFGAEAVFASKRQWFAAARSWGIILLATILAALITPNGISGLIFPIKLLTMKSLSFINEWNSGSFSQFRSFEAALFVALLFFLGRGVKIPFFRLFTLLGLLYETLQHQRYAALFVALGSLLIAEPVFQALDRDRWGRRMHDMHRYVPTVGALVCSALLVAAIVRVNIPQPIRNGPLTPVTALAQVAPDVARQPVFNQYILGGFLIFNHIRPFVDGRADMYGDAFIDQYEKLVIKPDAAALKKVLAKYGVVWTILAPDNPANVALDELPNWKKIYEDKFAAVHLRRDVTER